MAFTAKVLADGLLPDPVGTLYTVPGATVAYIKKIIAINISQYEQYAYFYKNASGTDREIGRAFLAPGERLELTDIIAAAGDTIRGMATDPSSVSYIIDGVEEA